MILCVKTHKDTIIADSVGSHVLVPIKTIFERSGACEPAQEVKRYIFRPLTSSARHRRKSLPSRAVELPT